MFFFVFLCVFFGRYRLHPSRNQASVWNDVVCLRLYSTFFLSRRVCIVKMDCNAASCGEVWNPHIFAATTTIMGVAVS